MGCQSNRLKGGVMEPSVDTFTYSLCDNDNHVIIKFLQLLHIDNHTLYMLSSLVQNLPDLTIFVY